MFGMKLVAAKEGFFDRKKIIDAVDKAERRVLSKFGAFTRTRARTSIRRRKRVSEPGQPPSSHTDLLRKFILFAYDVTTRSVVIGPVKLNRPGEAPELLEYGGETTIDVRIGNKKERRRARYRARPYMRPAFQEELKDLPDLWKNSVR